MLPRYEYPGIARLWTDQAQINLWGDIEAAVLEAILGIPVDPPRVPAAAVRDLEREVGHEVGAFLQLCEHDLPDLAHRRWLHYGLTSSDLVDTARSITLWHTNQEITELAAQLHIAIYNLDEVPVLGRTHGQVASPTSYRHRWLAAAAYLAGYPDMFRVSNRQRPVGKLSGATGNYRVLRREQAERAAEILRVDLAPFSTQVLPAGYTLDYLEYWLRVVMLCEQIALDLRLGAMLGEVAFPAKQVGSTAMPGKVNPLAAEQICGLTKLWRGMYSSWLESRALWLDRDLHHSSLDRVALGDLASLAGYLVNATRTALESVRLKHSPAASDAHSATTKMQSGADLVLSWATDRYALPRSVVYRAVTDALRTSPNLGVALRKVSACLAECQAPDTVES